MSPIVKEHVRAYSSTYFIAGLFVLITLLQSFVAQFSEFKDYTPEQLSSVTGIQWTFAVCNSFISAGVVILAFLNQTFARANQKRENGNGASHAPFKE